jgi:hypothetical protein
VNVSDLEAFIDESIRVSRQHHYYPTVFQGMRARHGTVAAIEKLVLSGEIQSGFKKLKDLGLLDWTIEAAVLRFPGEFHNREVHEAARWRLEQARDVA